MLRAEDFPKKEGYVIVGKVQRAHGIRGELFLYVFSKEADWLDELEEVCLVQHMGKDQFERFSFKVLRKRWHKEGIVVSLVDVPDRNRAEELKGAMFEVPETFFVSATDESFYLREIEGFTVQSSDGEELGVIVGFSSNTVQDLARVKNANGTFDVPLVDEWIVDRDSEKKVIVMELPEGLFGEDS